MSPIVRLSTLQQFAAVNLTLDPGAVGGPVIVPQCMQVVFKWSLASGKIAHNVLYGRYAGTVTPTAAMANGIMTTLTSGATWTALAAFISNNQSFSGVDLRDVNTEDRPIVSSTNAAVPGTNLVQPMPDEMAIVITLRTANAGIGHRGRIYIPGWASDAVAAGNVIPPAVVTALQNWANTITSAFSAQALTLVLGLRERQEYIGSTGTLHAHRDATSEQITSLSVRDNHWDSQRRRGLK